VVNLYVNTYFGNKKKKLEFKSYCSCNDSDMNAIYLSYVNVKYKYKFDGRKYSVFIFTYLQTLEVSKYKVERLIYKIQYVNITYSNISMDYYCLNLNSLSK